MPDHKKTFPQWKSQNMAQLLSNLSPTALQLILQMLTYNPDRRITAKTALESEYFQGVSSDLVIPPTVQTVKNVLVNENGNTSTVTSDTQ